MPNHIHGILIITGRGEASQSNTTALPSQAIKDASPLRPTGTTSGTIGAIIQDHKSMTSRKIAVHDRKIRISIWQRNYYEHIIRDERELKSITDYIQTNPKNWEKDKKYCAKKALKTDGS